LAAHVGKNSQSRRQHCSKKLCNEDLILTRRVR
jgi:hypothetical protein